MVSYDPSGHLITLFNDSGLDHAALTAAPNYYHDYTYNINAQSNTATFSQQFTLRVLNPCVDPTYTSIQTHNDFSVDYLVHSNAKVIDYTNGFSIGNSAEVAALCGTVKFTVTSGITAEIKNL